MRLCLQQWMLDDSLPDDPDDMRRIAGASESEWQTIWPKLEPDFPTCGDARRNAEMSRAYADASAECAARKSKARKGADARWKRKEADGKKADPVTPPADPGPKTLYMAEGRDDDILAAM